LHYEKPMIRLCSETGRLFLRHGPIDMFVKIDAENTDIVRKAYHKIAEHFGDILPQLSDELPVLRTEIKRIYDLPSGSVAARMYNSATRFSEYGYVTPMIAVAGSVADHVCNLVEPFDDINRILVNNGGDISLRLNEGTALNVGICDDITEPEISTTATIRSDSGIGGVATSGWKGRSFSLGIADAVTVLASTAALADAAATLIANAVDIPYSNKIDRQKASSISPDSDLGDKLVTTQVANLSHVEIEEALLRGKECAKKLRASGLVDTVYIALKGKRMIVGGQSQSSLPLPQISKPETQERNPELSYA